MLDILFSSIVCTIFTWPLCNSVDNLFPIFLKYISLQKRLLTRWLSPQDKDENWSVWARTSELSDLLGRFCFPSTTTRHPRPLQKFAKYKGSEIRLILLFGYSIFENVLKPEYYSHLLVLVLAIHYVSY